MLFGQKDPFERLQAVQISISLIVGILLIFGPYDHFYVDMAPWLYAPKAPFEWFPILEMHFWTLKYSVLILAFLAPFNYRIFKILFGISFLFFNFYVKSFSTTWWITNTHLNFFAIALCFTPRYRTQKSMELASFLVSFMTLYIAALYFQAGLSKLLHGGIYWFFDGSRILTETILLGTPFGKWLTQWPQVFTVMSFATGLFELFLPPFFLFSSTQRLAALCAFFFHMGTFIVMGISFWFLWALYPALFLISSRRKLETLRHDYDCFWCNCNTK